MDIGIAPNEAWEAATSPLAEIVVFTAQQAQIAGDMIPHTRPFGLSLGDRACLALAIALDAPVYTADQVWKKLRLRIPLHLIR